MNTKLKNRRHRDRKTRNRNRKRRNSKSRGRFYRRTYMCNYSRKNNRKKVKTKKKPRRGAKKNIRLSRIKSRRVKLGGANDQTSQPINALRDLYRGDPEEINKHLTEYRKVLEDNEEFDIFDDNSELIQKIIKERKYNIPKYISIKGHGGLLSPYEEDFFTLVPRNFKLILATGTGEKQTTFRDSHYVGGPLQKNPSYYRVYEGLIPNQEIDFNLIYRGPDKTLLVGDPIRECHLDEEKYGEKCALASVPGVNVVTVANTGADDEDTLFTYANFMSDEIGSIPYELAENVNYPDRNPSDDDLNTYSDIFVDNLVDITDTNKKHLKTDVITYLSILPKEEIKRQIMEKKTMHLSQIFKIIEKKKYDERYDDIPSVIVGGFCRCGLDIEPIDHLVNLCIDPPPKLPKLTHDYFSENRYYEGVSDSLIRQHSLASKVKPQDFWNIYENLKLNLINFDEDVKKSFNNIIKKIEEKSENIRQSNGLYKGINLSLNDVCLIFEMDYFLNA